MTREERLLAAACKNREAFSTLMPLIKKEDMRAQYLSVWDSIKDYYKKDSSATEVDVALLRDSLNTRYPKHTSTFNLILDNLQDVSCDNVIDEYVELRQSVVGMRLAERLLEGAEQRELRELMDEWEGVVEIKSAPSRVVRNPDIASIIQTYRPENLIRVWPQSLNEQLGGGVIPGDQMVVYANTEVGKTLFTINMACGFLRDGRSVLYCGNEDAEEAMLTRIFSNLSGMTREEILQNPAQAQHRASQRGVDNLNFASLDPGSITEVETLVREIKPKVLIIDQMANLDGAEKFSKVEKNEELAKDLRSIAKRDKLVSVIVHQADDAAHGRLVLEKNNMHYSNIGVQGQMDIMIGIGMDSVHEQTNRRMVTLAKNKTNGNHSSFPITVEPALSRVK